MKQFKRMKRAISYGRVSDDKQALNSSVSGQHETNARECNRMGYDIVKSFSDVETATDDRRQGLHKAYDYCKSLAGTPAAISLLAIYDWSRWFRNFEKAILWRAKFREIGVNVNCPLKWFDEDDEGSLIIYLVRLGSAQGESMKISRRTRRGNYYTMLKGYYIFTAPVGYLRSKTIGENNKRLLEIDPERGPAMRQVFKQIAAGHTPAYTYRMCGARQLLGSFSQYMRNLRNPIYKGIILAKSNLPELETVEVKSKNPSLIDPETFDTVQVILSKKEDRNYEKGSTTLFPAKGVLKCPECGHGCTSSMPLNKARNTYYYYRCSANSKHFRISRRIADDAIEQVLSSCMIDNKYHSLVEDKINQKTAKVMKQLKARKNILSSNLSREKARAEKAMNFMLDGTITKEDYLKIKSRIEEMELKLRKLKKALMHQNSVKSIALELLFNLPKLSEDVLCFLSMMYDIL